MNFFPACTPSELMAPFWVALSVLIPSDTSGLLVPAYPGGQCPEPTRFRVSDYAAGFNGNLFVPLYSNQSFMMERFSRPFSALTHV